MYHQKNNQPKFNHKLNGRSLKNTLTYSIFAISSLLSTLTAGQQPLITSMTLQLTPANSSNLLGQERSLTVYAQEPEPLMLELVTEILQNAQLTHRDFDIRIADVPSIMVYIEGNRKLLLYHPGFLIGIRDFSTYNWRKIAHLGHALGHLYYNHQLGTGPGRVQEELAADRFNGHLMGKLGAGIHDVLAALEHYHAGNPTIYPPKADRLRALEGSWEQSQITKSGPLTKRNSKLLPAPIAPLAEGPGPGTDYKDVSFPFPPPKASASQILPWRFFEDAIQLGDVDQILSEAIGFCGYNEKSYYYVPDGFALVTKLEQINVDATPKLPPDRWSPNLLPLQRFSLGDYLRALFMGKKGHFRVFVFIVTPYPFSQRPDAPTKAIAQNWLVSGFNILPKPLAELPFNSDYSVTTLIYQFELVENGESRFVEQSWHSCQTHLERSNILQHLAR